jgi:hypothetical protein
MAYSRSFMFLGVILFVILSTQVLAANHVPELSISGESYTSLSFTFASHINFIDLYSSVIR